MQVRQINIFGGDDMIELLVDKTTFSPQAQDHIRLLKNLSQEIMILNSSDFLPEEYEYIRFLRERMAAALVKSLQN